MVTHYEGMPTKDKMEYMYHDALISSDETMIFQCKGPYRFAEQRLVVDGIWKDSKSVEGYHLQIECSTAAQINLLPIRHGKNHILSDMVVSRCLVW